MKKKVPKFTQLPKGFIPWKGRCSWDMPQELFGVDDHLKIQVILRNKEVVKSKIYKIDWTNTLKKTDIVGWKKPKCLIRKRKNRKEK